MFKSIKFLSVYSAVSGLRSIIFDAMVFFYVRIYGLAVLSLNILNWLFAYFINVKISRNLAVLHYNVDFGVNLIGDIKEIYAIPLLGLFIFVLNFALLVFSSRLNYRIASSGKFIAHILMASAFLANLFLLASLALVYLVNFYR